MQLGAQPWHLWGQVVQFNARSTNFVNLNPQQIAQVDYGRPETWKPFFAVAIQGEPGTTWPLPGVTQSLLFDLSIGVGRSNFRIPAFWRAQFDSGALATNSYQIQWTTQPRSTNQVVGAEPAVPSFADFFPAQTIQIQVSGSLQFNGSVNITAVAYFAPLHHARPDWFMRKFKGELDGR